MMFVGFIIMWSGVISNIPKGWVLCDGANGTPNMVNKFIKCTVTESQVGVYGGNSLPALNETHLPSHNHDFASQYTDYEGHHLHMYKANDGGTYTSGKFRDAGSYSANYSLENAGIHSHSGYTGYTGAANLDITPPYYKLAFLMYKGD